MRFARPKAVRTFVAALAIGLIATGCAESERDEDGSSDGSEPLVFGAPGDPASLDPALASDGETFRVTRQAFEALLRHETGGTELVGGLAKTWRSNDAGTQWTFELRDGVTFHDGEKLTAEAVCKNYDHWFNYTGTYQNPALTYYWQTVFGGFANNESEDTPPANYVGCTAPDPLTAVIEVKEASANLPGGFSLQAFGIHSPKAIDAYEQQQATGENENINYPDYSQQAGTVAGTGPFRITDWNKGNGEVTLERFDKYWGDPAGVEELVFRTISKENARRQALQAGNIHGYDLVAPGDVQTLLDEGFQVPTRDVFNILYLGFTQERNPALEDIRVRQAIAHALDRQTLVDTQLPEGGVVASQFIPDTVEGYSEDVTTYDYDKQEAQDLLAAAGAEDLTVDFCYPTEVTRPYMPNPEDLFQLLSADLQAAGINVNPQSKVWNPTYVDTVETGGCDLFLLGWTGDFNDAFNFLGTWFSNYDPQWGFRNAELFDLMAQAEKEPDLDTRVSLYQQVNEAVMDFLPGVPISSSPPSIAFAENVNPPTVSPLTQEDFAEASFK